MRKIYYFTILSIILITCLQASYLKSTYNSYADKISFQIEKEMYNIIDNELIFRLSQQENIVKQKKQMSIQYKTVDDLKSDSLLSILQSAPTAKKFDLETLQNNNIINNSSDIVNQAMQDRLFQQGHTVDLKAIDSLFQKANIISKRYCFELVNHSLGKSYYSGRWIDETLYAHKTKEFPIGLQNHQTLQLYYDIPLSSFMKISIGSLVTSFLIILIVATTLFIQLNTISKKHKTVNNIQNTINGTIHDLRAPLNGTVMAIELVRKSLSDRALLDIMERSRITINNLLRNIETLLEIAKSNSAAFTVNKEICNSKVLSDMCDRVHKELSSLCGKTHNIIIDNKLPGTFSIQVDYIALEAVVRNLTENALKYSDDGVYITITLEARDKDLCVSVKDNGWGIDSKYKKHLFNSFFQVPNPLKKQQGFGIGLFQVKRIIEAHNGVLTVDSTVNNGSTFRFTIKQS